MIGVAEIGQGAKIALQKTIASMGANNLMIQSGAASSGGVSFGAGSVLTLTPQDAEEIGKQCPAVSDVAPIVRAGGQVIYGNHNWVPMSIYGTSPSYLDVRDWNDMLEGGMFTDRDVLERQQGLRGRHHHQARTVSRRIARRQGTSHPERLAPRHRRAFAQGLEHDGHGPGRYHPRSVDHDQVPP